MGKWGRTSSSSPRPTNDPTPPPLTMESLKPHTPIIFLCPVVCGCIPLKPHPPPPRPHSTHPPHDKAHSLLLHYSVSYSPSCPPCLSRTPPPFSHPYAPSPPHKAHLFGFCSRRHVVSSPVPKTPHQQLLSSYSFFFLQKTYTRPFSLVSSTAVQLFFLLLLLLLPPSLFSFLYFPFPFISACQVRIHLSPPRPSRRLVCTFKAISFFCFREERHHALHLKGQRGKFPDLTMRKATPPPSAVNQLLRLNIFTCKTWVQPPAAAKTDPLPVPHHVRFSLREEPRRSRQQSPLCVRRGLRSPSSMQATTVWGRRPEAREQGRRAGEFGVGSGRLPNRPFLHPPPLSPPRLNSSSSPVPPPPLPPSLPPPARQRGVSGEKEGVRGIFLLYSAVCVEEEGEEARLRIALFSPPPPPSYVASPHPTPPRPPAHTLSAPFMV